MNERTPFQGVRQIARYNMRFYVGTPLICLGFQVASRNRRLPRALRVLMACGMAATTWWTLASLLVSYWVYDRSLLMHWKWITEVLPASPKRWANLHCGLDESTDALGELFPDSEGVALDFFDENAMREPSIAVARRLESTREMLAPSTPIDFRNFPQCDSCFDTIFLFFSAHEIRDADLRLQFFKELKRVLCRGGRVLLIEHPRDAANFLAFGPGFFHFWPRSEWRRLARESDFKITREFPITPFVRVWLLEKR